MDNFKSAVERIPAARSHQEWAKLWNSAAMAGKDFAD
jgi:hypothetical protein